MSEHSDHPAKKNLTLTQTDSPEESQENKPDLTAEDVVRNISDDLNLHSFALRAFGALLESSGLWLFSDQHLADTLKSKDFRAAELRGGLNQIIELYLSHQEKILAGYSEQFQKSDAVLIQQATFTGLRLVYGTAAEFWVMTLI